MGRVFAVDACKVSPQSLAARIVSFERKSQSRRIAPQHRSIGDDRNGDNPDIGEVITVQSGADGSIVLFEIEVSGGEGQAVNNDRALKGMRHGPRVVPASTSRRYDFPAYIKLNQLSDRGVGSK